MSANGSENPTAEQSPFSGTWYFSATSQDVIDDILGKGGWKPELNTNTIYGTAIYLANCNWHSELAADFIIACELDVPEENGMFNFDATGFDKTRGVGNTEKHLRGYLYANKVPASPTTCSGSNYKNMERRDFFLKAKIKAIYFIEHGVPVVAVFDTSVIVKKWKIAREEVPDNPTALSGWRLDALGPVDSTNSQEM